jgi:thiol-disulfide isomerase/thioredoxin
MKQLILYLVLFWSGNLVAQEIPFIRRDQIEYWKNTPSDTIYVVNFWATWCAPCVAELPAFEKLHERYSGKNVQVVLVSNDFKKQVESKLKPFVRQKKLKSKVVFMDESNPNSWINLVSTEWSGSIPATLLISTKKNKVLFFEKPLKYKALERALRSMM